MRGEERNETTNTATPKISIHHDRRIVRRIMTKNPSTKATYELRENVKRSAAIKILNAIRRVRDTRSPESICARTRTAKNAKSPPKRFGSNHVERSLPACGSQPSGTIKEKSGKITNCKNPSTPNKTPVPSTIEKSRLM